MRMAAMQTQPSDYEPYNVPAASRQASQAMSDETDDARTPGMALPGVSSRMVLNSDDLPESDGEEEEENENEALYAKSGPNVTKGGKQKIVPTAASAEDAEYEYYYEEEE